MTRRRFVRPDRSEDDIDRARADAAAWEARMRGNRDRPPLVPYPPKDAADPGNPRRRAARQATVDLHRREDNDRRATARRNRLENPPPERDTIHATTLSTPFAASVRRISGTRSTATRRPKPPKRRRGAPTGEAAQREPIGDDLRWQILNRDGHRCRYCGSAHGPFHVDHVIPVALGGPTVYANLVTACAPCNLRKGATVWTPMPINR